MASSSFSALNQTDFYLSCIMEIHGLMKLIDKIQIFWFQTSNLRDRDLNHLSPVLVWVSYSYEYFSVFSRSFKAKYRLWLMELSMHEYLIRNQSFSQIFMQCFSYYKMTILPPTSVTVTCLLLMLLNCGLNVKQWIQALLLPYHDILG